MHSDSEVPPPVSGPVEPGLPEELVAVITDNSVAAKLIGALPEDDRANQAQWVADGDGRQERARRAVDVVRHAIEIREEPPDLPNS